MTGGVTVRIPKCGEKEVFRWSPLQQWDSDLRYFHFLQTPLITISISPSPREQCSYFGGARS
ncbi:Hypothetical protein SMAX5B_004840 [Scophthalmus maximus]|uniref:Uncharacterized protein n=1 Tax=Scophthalmus maximus TaxID=52904 RepID=A0A2U9B9T6_SCOMX|nr:Hypothetical protein SMAX5B_004840 [Scophthalmus maximus]